MNYNEFVENVTPLLMALRPIFNLNVSQTDTMELLNLDVVQPEKTYPECMISQIPYEYTIRLDLGFTEGSTLHGTTFSTYFKLPKMCERGFLMKAPDGKMRWRSPINIGTVKKYVGVFGYGRSAVLHVNGGGGVGIYVYLYPSQTKDGKFIPPHIDIIKYSKTGDKLLVKQYNLYNYLKSCGIQDVDNYVETVSLDVMANNNFSNDYEPIGLNNYNIDKLKYKYYQLTGIEINFDPIDPIFTGDQLYQLIKLYHHDHDIFEVFTPFDVEFYSFSDIIFKKELPKIKLFKHRISSYVTQDIKAGKSPHINGGTITNAFQQIFSMYDSKYNAIQSSSTSNAASFLSQTNKIYFISFDKKKKSLQYTKEFYGIVCPSKTPEGVGLCNVKNELAADVTVTENGLEVKLLNTNKEEVSVKYYDYYKSRILSLDNYDYDNNKVLPDKDGNVKILNKGEFKKVKYEPGCFDYIRESPESSLAINTGLIPFANRTDGVRLAMATNQTDQAIPVEGSRPPVVGTRNSKLVYNRSDLNWKSPYSGKVLAVIENYIKVQTDSGEIKIITTPPQLQSNAHTFNRFRPAVKPGDRIKPGTILMESDSFKDKSLSLTVPLKVAYMVYKAKTDQDAIVISQSASEKLAHRVDTEITIDIPHGRKFMFDKASIIGRLKNPADASKFDSLNELCLPDVGSTFRRGDILGMYFLQSDPEKGRAKLHALIQKKGSTETDFEVEQIPAPYNVNDYKILSVKVYYRNEVRTDPELLKLYEYYKIYNDKKKAELQSILGDYEIPEKKVVLGIGRAGVNDPDVRIVIKTTSLNYAKKGDKIANRYASKGTISDVMPDREMPRVGGPDGPNIDIIMPPMSTMNRKNLAQLMEMNLCEVSKLAWELNEKLLKEDTEDSYKKVADNLNKLYITDRFSKMGDVKLNNFHREFNGFYNIEVGAIDKKYTIDKLVEISNHFGYNLEGEKMYLPEYDMMTKTPVIYGITEIMRLHFIPEYKAKATAAEDFNDKLVLGIGSGKLGGQKIGQMEVWALTAYDTLDEFNKLANRDNEENAYDSTINEALTQMRLIGLNVHGLTKDFAKKIKEPVNE